MNVLLEVTSFTWMVTGLGFGIVLLLLCFFVFVILGVGSLFRTRHEDKKETTPATQPIQQHNKTTGNPEINAAIALTLHLYFNSLHDIEPVKVTVIPHPTQWNNKMYGMNNLHR